MNAGVRPALIATLLGAAFVSALLALYQWMELLLGQASGSFSCSVSATLDCGPVWGSKAAKAIGEMARMPVAALGLVWGIAASALSVGLAARLQTGAIGAWVAAVRVAALAGVVATVGLAAISLSLGVLCPTCLLTYALVVIFAAASLRLPGPLAEGIGPGAGLAAGIAIASYLVLLVPASRGPKSAEDVMKKALAAVPAATAAAQPASPGPSPAGPGPTAPGDLLGEVLGQLSPQGLQALADVMRMYRESKTYAREGDVSRFSKGPSMAPVEMIEWTDIKCGHCAIFIRQLDELLARVPPEAIRVEPRQFPLDKECNPTMTHPSPGDGTRCAAARALICLEGSEAYFAAQKAMFAEQDTLTKKSVLDIARRLAGDAKAFDACLDSPKTAEKLAADIAFAERADVHGTPHVLLNGKIAPPFPPFLLAYFMTSGRLDHPALAKLPPGRPPQPHDHAH